MINGFYLKPTLNRIKNISSLNNTKQIKILSNNLDNINSNKFYLKNYYSILFDNKLKFFEVFPFVNQNLYHLGCYKITLIERNIDLWHLCLQCDFTGVIIGYISIVPSNIHKLSYNVIYIQIISSYRNDGFGSFLFNFLLKFCKKNDMKLSITYNNKTDSLYFLEKITGSVINQLSENCEKTIYF